MFENIVKSNEKLTSLDSLFWTFVAEIGYDFFLKTFGIFKGF